jgi:hypothetical protein
MHVYFGEAAEVLSGDAADAEWKAKRQFYKRRDQ